MRAEADSRAAEVVALRKRIDSLENMADRLLAELAHLKKQGNVRGSLDGNAHRSLEDEKWQATPRIVMDATHFAALTKHFEANFVKIADFLAWVRETHDVIGRLWEGLTVIPGSTGIGSGVLDDREASEMGLVEETTAACHRLQSTVQTLETLGQQINKQSLVPSALSPLGSNGMDSSSRWKRASTAEVAALGSSTSLASNETSQAAMASRPVEKNRLLWNPDSQSQTVEY